MAVRITTKAYLSPHSGIDGRGVSDMIERGSAARHGSNKLLMAYLRYYKNRRVAG